MPLQAFTKDYPPIAPTPARLPDRKLLKAHRENFPVASWFLPRHARQSILAFYHFARLADNIADDPELDSHEKYTSLNVLRNALADKHTEGLPEAMQPYGRLVAEGKCSSAHGIALLDAFLQDAVQQRYPDYPALLDYCMHSAAPVGRTVLELCGETNADLHAADSLCNALQLLNHLQDCQEDFQTLDRVYLPENWMQDANADTAMLNRIETAPALQNVFNRWNDATQNLLDASASLPATVRSRRLRLELCIILALATRLLAQLRTHDPLRRKIRLTPWQVAGAVCHGIMIFWKA